VVLRRWVRRALASELDCSACQGAARRPAGRSLHPHAARELRMALAVCRPGSSRQRTSCSIFACSGRQFPATPGIVSPFFPDSFPRDPLCRHTGVVRLNPALASSIQEITASGEIGGARVGKPRHSRIPRMASGEWMAAMILMRPRQRNSGLHPHRVAADGFGDCPVLLYVGNDLVAHTRLFPFPARTA
jgi:hypothetical protein